MEKTIYDLRLHEILRVDKSVYVTRVPGGWIYHFWDFLDKMDSMVFVPLNDEFKIK